MFPSALQENFTVFCHLRLRTPETEKYWLLLSVSCMIYSLSGSHGCQTLIYLLVDISDYKGMNRQKPEIKHCIDTTFLPWLPREAFFFWQINLLLYFPSIYLTLKSKTTVQVMPLLFFTHRSVKNTFFTPKVVTFWCDIICVIWSLW